MARPNLLEYDVKSQIKSYLVALKRKNPRLSLRALARRTGINPTSLSLFLNGKRELSPASCRRLLALMNSEDPTIADDATLVELGRSRKQYVEAADADRIELLSHWLPLAVLSLLETSEAVSEPAVVARRLHVSREEARGALQVLERLGLVAPVRGRLEPTGASLTGGTVRGVSEHVRKAQLSPASSARLRIKSA
jgi:transcriptional regulator with XRE-family HTH domain